MNRFALILALLLIVHQAVAQTEEPVSEPVATNTTIATADATNTLIEVADTNSVTALTGTNAVLDVHATNVTEHVEVTNRIETADALLQGVRDPFWPVGYEPPPPEPELSDEEAALAQIEEAIENKIQWPALHLKGVTRAGKDRYMAFIKGVGVVESNQTIRIRKDDILYSWLIEEVSAKGVKITRLDAKPYHPPRIGVRTQ